MICEWFHAWSQGKYPGHWNIYLHRIVTVFTACAVAVHASREALRTQAAFWLALCVANVFYECARRMDCGTYATVLEGGEVNGKPIPATAAWCKTCQHPRMERSHHCRLCNKCVVRFDHHCVYLNACVGARTLRFFFAMLVSEFLHLGLGLWLLYEPLRDECSYINVWQCSPLLSTGFLTLLVFFIAVVALTLAVTARISMNKTTKELVRPPTYMREGNRFDLGSSENWSQCFEG